MNRLSYYLRLDRFSDGDVVAAQRYIDRSLSLENSQQYVEALLSDDSRMDLLVAVSVLDRLAKEACQVCQGDVFLETLTEDELLPEALTERLDVGPDCAIAWEPCQGPGHDSDLAAGEPRVELISGNELISGVGPISGLRKYRGLFALAACMLFALG